MKRPEDNKYFHYYNANPKNKDTKDCTYRALSLFLDKSWDDIASLDAEFYLEHGMWLYTTEYTDNCFESSVGLFLKRFSCPELDLTSKGIFTIRDFINKAAESDKTYLIYTGNHMTVVKEGLVRDTWDSSDSGIVAIFEKRDR